MTDWSRVDESVGYYPELFGRYEALVEAYTGEDTVQIKMQFCVPCNSFGEYDDMRDVYDAVSKKLKEMNIDYDDYDIAESDIDFLEFA